MHLTKVRIAETTHPHHSCIAGLIAQNMGKEMETILAILEAEASSGDDAGRWCT